MIEKKKYKKVWCIKNISEDLTFNIKYVYSNNSYELTNTFTELRKNQNNPNSLYRRKTMEEKEAAKGVRDLND